MASEDPSDEDRESAAESGDDPFYSPDSGASGSGDGSAAGSGAEDTVSAAGEATEGDSSASDTPVVDESATPDIEADRCSNCDAPIASDAAFCPDCGAEQGDSDADGDGGPAETKSGKDVEPLFSAVLSFFLPGIGHIYHGQSERGIAIFLGWIAWWFVLGVLFLLVTIVTLGVGVLTIVFLPVVDLAYHVVAAADSYVQAEKIATGQKEP